MRSCTIGMMRALGALAILATGLTLVPGLVRAAAPAHLAIVEHAAECTMLDLLLTSPTSGVVRARRCDDCPLLTLEVDADTRVYRSGRLVTLSEADNNQDRGATVMFDPASGRVTRLLLRP